MGNYSYYIEKKKNPLRFQELEEQEGKTKTQIQYEKKKKKEEEKLQKQKQSKIKSIEETISDLEKSVEDLNNQLCLEEVYSNPERSEEVNKELANCEAKLEELYAEWESLL